MEAGVSNYNNNDDPRGLPPQTAESVMRKSTPPPFLVKTYTVVEDPTTDEVISWNGDGTAFVVWQTAEFAKDVLPKLFKHCNFSSFVRQLNTYCSLEERSQEVERLRKDVGRQAFLSRLVTVEELNKGFRKVATTRWEFCNDKFQKGEKEKLCEIRRRKAWTKQQQQQQQQHVSETTNLGEDQELDEDQRSSSSNSSFSEYNTLMDENKRLKKENGALSSELARMKNKCRELLDLAAKYGKSSNQEEEEEDERPKLFGVRLEIEGDRDRKRKRAEEIISETATFLLSQSCK